MIKTKDFELEKVDYNNIEHLKYLRLLMESKDMDYLWDIADRKLNNKSDGYIVKNNENGMIGYLNLSNPTESFYGRTISFYYAIEESKRGRGYGKCLIENMRDWLFCTEGIDCIVAQVEPGNIHSQNTLKSAGMKEMIRSEDFITFVEERQSKLK